MAIPINDNTAHMRADMVSLGDMVWGCSPQFGKSANQVITSVKPTIEPFRHLLANFAQFSYVSTFRFMRGLSMSDWTSQFRQGGTRHLRHFFLMPFGHGGVSKSGGVERAG